MLVSIRNRIHLLVIVFLIIIFFAIFIPNGFATVGVQKGTWVKYSTNASYESTIPGMTDPGTVGWTELLNSESDLFEVVDVVGNVITVRRTTYYKNGTQVVENKTGNVATGTGDLGAFLVGAELNVGDNVPPLKPLFNQEFYINETIYRNYLGLRREVNHLETHFAYSFFDVYLNAYWDRETGIETEVSAVISYHYLGNSLTASNSYTIIGTNSWQSPPIWIQWWFWVIIGAIIIASLSLTLFLKRKRTKKAQISVSNDQAHLSNVKPNT